MCQAVRPEAHIEKFEENVDTRDIIGIVEKLAAETAAAAAVQYQAPRNSLVASERGCSCKID